MGQDVVAPSGKSAGIATLLSCFFPGAGQIYLGQVLMGIVMLAVSYLVLPLWIIVWIVAMIDANKIGKKLEAGQSVQQWEFF